MKTERTVPYDDYEAVVNTIMAWPVAARFTLVQEILRRVADELAPTEWPRKPPIDMPGIEVYEPELSPAERRREGLRQLEGLLAKPGVTPPTDEDLARWKDERLMEKYG